MTTSNNDSIGLTSSQKKEIVKEAERAAMQAAFDIMHSRGIDPTSPEVQDILSDMYSNSDEIPITSPVTSEPITIEFKEIEDEEDEIIASIAKIEKRINRRRSGRDMRINFGVSSLVSCILGSSGLRYEPEIKK